MVIQETFLIQWNPSRRNTLASLKIGDLSQAVPHQFHVKSVNLVGSFIFLRQNIELKVENQTMDNRLHPARNDKPMENYSNKKHLRGQWQHLSLSYMKGGVPVYPGQVTFTHFFSHFTS